MTDELDMGDEQDTDEWQSEELRPTRGFRLPWLALAGVAATIIAATTLVIGISDSLDDDQPPGRLLPLQAASPPPPPPPPSPEEPTPEDTREKSKPRVHEALLRLRFSVNKGVEEGDVRDDVGLDLTNVIERILDRPWSPPERTRADVAYLHHKIATRTREGAIDDDRADEFHLILDHATD